MFRVQRVPPCMILPFCPDPIVPCSWGMLSLAKKGLIGGGAPSPDPAGVQAGMHLSPVSSPKTRLQGPLGFPCHCEWNCVSNPPLTVRSLGHLTPRGGGSRKDRQCRSHCLKVTPSVANDLQERIMNSHRIGAAGRERLRGGGVAT